MKKAKFREVVAKGEVEFKVKKSSDIWFDEGTIVTLFKNDGSDSPWFVASEYGEGARHGVSINDIKRLKKNKRKEKENV